MTRETEPLSGEAIDAVRHELSHFYWHEYIVPYWLNEGAATFLESYIRSQVDGLDLEERYDAVQQGVEMECGGATNVSDWYAMVKPEENCVYYVGVSFLLGVHNSLGERELLSSIREVYRQGEAYFYRLDDGEVYRAFLSGISSGKHDEFREIYGRLHGGPIPES